MIARRSFLQGAIAFAASPAFGRDFQGTAAIDTHAHVFRRDLPLAQRRRYTVDYDATLHDYLIMLRANGMARGVLIQPSFLGFDNGYLLRALEQHGEQLRGIVALPRQTSIDDMARLAKAGVAGIRLNLIGRNDPDFGSPEWRRHLAIVAQLGWQIEIQCEAARLPGLLPALVQSGAPVVVDHFGRPDAVLGVKDPGFRYLLEAAGSGQVYVKLSAPYRIGAKLAENAAPRLLNAFGPDRLLWGSDWPHTQFENVADAGECRSALDRWVPDPAARSAILTSTPTRLFGFKAFKAR